MCDLQRWTSLSLLAPDFVDNLQCSVVFGSAGSESLMITKDDQVFGMGTNFCSCLGASSHGSLEPTKLEYLSGRRIIQISFGAGPHIIALGDNGQLFSWGHNAFGQLGLGHSLQGTSPMLVQGVLLGEKVVSIACGGHHSVAITDRGEVFTWGLNSSGQLGLGNVINQDLPQLVPLYNRLVTTAACGHNSTMVLTQSGDVFAWGYNGNGQIGSANMCNQSTPFHIESLSKSGPITQIVCGYAHSLALSDQGNLYVWGSNSCGQLGGNLLRKNLGEPVQAAKELGRITEVAAVHLCNLTVVATKAGKIYMWGHLRGQSCASPIETRFSTVDDVFACFASPPVSYRMLKFRAERKTSILDAIRVAFDDPTTADLRISVEGHIIHAHKALLKMRCQYFKTRLGGVWADSKENEIIVNDFSYPIFRSFLNWLYTDDLNLQDAEDAIELLELANCYCETSLKMKCASLLQKGISTDNAAQLYSIAVKYDVTDLEECCFKFCLNHMTAVTQSDAFRQLDDFSIKKLISRASKEGIFKR